MRACVCCTCCDEFKLEQVLPESTFTRNQTENRTINMPGDAIQPQFLCGVVAREPGWELRVWCLLTGLKPVQSTFTRNRTENRKRNMPGDVLRHNTSVLWW